MLVLMDVESLDDLRDLLTAAQAAALLPDTSAPTVLRWAKDGRLPFIELPGGVRSRKYFRRADIEALLKPRVAGRARDGVGRSPDDPIPGQGRLAWPAAGSGGVSL